MTQNTLPFYELSPDHDFLIKITDSNYPDQNPNFNLHKEDYKDVSGESGDINSRLLDPAPLNLYEPLVISGYFDTLAYFDLLPIWLALPVITRRFLTVLQLVGPLPDEALPVRIVDAEDPAVLFNERLFADDAYAAGHRYNDNYVLLRPLEPVDISPWLAAEPPDPSKVLPPIFRRQDHVGLHVSAAARDAILQAGIRGCEMTTPYPLRLS